MKTTVRMLRVVESDELPLILQAPAPVPVRSVTSRAFALGLLAATVAAIGWAGATAYHVVTDAWIAPLHLSRDNDSVAQLRLAHQRNLSELARLDAEVTRFEGEMTAIASAITTLSTLRDSARSTLAWQAEQSRIEAGGLTEQIGLMRHQLTTLEELHTRQEQLVTKARADLAAGLVDRTAVDREEQVRDGFTVEISELTRQISETTLRGTQNASAWRALSGHKAMVGRMPEVAAGDEHTARIDVEIERLRAEARGDRAQHEAAKTAAAAQRELLGELEARPLYRAMTAATDVAFVPYTQLDKLAPGASVIACSWSVFDCHRVGHVAEVVPGEVVTQDPWGELARGQYAVLALDDKDAVRERVLRVR